MQEYLGGIYYFLERRKLDSLRELETKAPVEASQSKGDTEQTAAQGKLSYEQRKEQEKQMRKAKKVVEKIEEELEALEQKIKSYDERFAAASEYVESDYKEYNELKSNYDHMMHEWEKANYELEIIENR